MASKKLAFLEMMFMFDPAETWGSIVDFEDELGKYFKSIGCRAEVVDAFRGYQGRRLIYITRIKDELDNPARLKPKGK